MITLKINSKEITAEANTSILNCALGNGVYIPHLCSHPDLVPLANSDLQANNIIFQGENGIKTGSGGNSEITKGSVVHSHASASDGCQLCLVEISGETELQRACAVTVRSNMEISTDSERVKQVRQSNLAKIIALHPHSCLTCAQSEGCSLTQCSSNVPQNERCCTKFGRCELQKVAQYIGIPLTTPRYIPQNIPVIDSDPLFKRDYNLCISCLRCVRACRSLRGIDALGFVINSGNTTFNSPQNSANRELKIVSPEFQITVGSRQPSLIDSGCKFCGACAEVCPTGAILDKITISADRTKSLVPCQGACPVGMDAPNYIRFIKEDRPDGRPLKIGRINESFEVIRHKVPFPSVLGRVCFHPCEENCRRKELNPVRDRSSYSNADDRDAVSNSYSAIHAKTQSKTSNELAGISNGVNEPISICALKRYAAENASTPIIPQSAIRNPKSPVAIIGSGPSGLSAAYYLAEKGYPVTVFEANKEIGGMMRYAIPEYRLPLSVLTNDLNKITKHPNINIKTNTRLGRDFTIDSLKQEGYKAILIAIGAQLPKKILQKPLTANRKPQTEIVWGIDFLKDIRNGKLQADKFNGKSVLVIGGGNVAVDVALSAKRLGAKSVQMVCLESREEMPAHEWEIKQAMEEGIALSCSWGPKDITELSGLSISGMFNLSLDVVQCTSVFDQNGKFNPSFNADVCRTFQTNIIIAAIGQTTESVLVPFALNPNKTIKVDENTMAVQDNIFACGEAVHNPSSIVESIADGRKAAENIDKFLGGDGVITKELDIPKPNPYFGRDEQFFGYMRQTMPCLELAKRERNFNMVELGYDKEKAQNEARRCLQCDVRLRITPVIFPPETSRKGTMQELEFTEANIKTIPAKEGVYILMDADKNTLVIKGAMNLQQALMEQLNNSKAKCLQYEVEPMYTKKESELIQQYLQKYGKLPSGGDELDDLY